MTNRWTARKPAQMIRSCLSGRTLAVLVLLTLLVVLGSLQFRWIGEISRAEARHRHEQLHQAAVRIAADLRFEAASELASLRPLPSPQLSHPGAPALAPLPWPAERHWLNRRWRRWQHQHREGSLFADIAILRHRRNGQLVVYGWDRKRERLVRRPRAKMRRMPAPWRGSPMIVQPLLSFLPPGKARAADRIRFFRRNWIWAPPPVRRRPGGARRRIPTAVFPDMLAVRLQPDYLRQIMPQLLERELGRQWRENYRVGFYAYSPQRKTLFETVPAPQPEAATVRQILLAWGRPILRMQVEHGVLPRLRPDAAQPRRGQLFLTLRTAPRPAWLMAGGPGVMWRLWLEPRPSRFEALITSERWRNLGLSFGILAVLAASLLLLALESRRARQLAGRQMDFVAGITHELRSPLAVMAAASDNLADGVVLTQAAVRQHGEAIRRQARRLAQMIEQILEFAALKSGKRAYRLEAVDLEELLQEVAAQSRGLLAESQATLRLAGAAALPPVSADRAALSQALQNLIGNAVKFGGGGVQIEITAGLEAGSGQIRIAVSDNGPGIPAAELQQIFEPFYRGSQARADQIRGSGLGLSLVRQSITAMSGRVWAESAPGDGSRFFIQLPLAPPAAAPFPKEIREEENPAG